MPPLRRVQAALGETTERFASELAAPALEPPRWDEFEWIIARATAVLNGVTPLMASTLRWQGPPEWQRFVEQQRCHTLLRHQRIEVLLARIHEVARRAGLAAVPLKGAALHALGLYRPGQRPMADIDLLVRERDAEPMLRVLQSLGYRETWATRRHRILHPQKPASAASVPVEPAFGEHALAPIKIELHDRICESLPVLTVDVSERIFPGAPEVGLNAYPSDVALLTHLVLHAAGNMVARVLRLIHLHDISLVAARMGEPEWMGFLQSRVAGRPLWWAAPPLELASRYYPRRIPHEVLAALRTECPRTLRSKLQRQTLSDVSFAALEMEAFPGLAWTASLSEKLQCVLARVHPGPEQLALRAVVQAEPWSGDWSRLSQSQRILRAILMRPPRQCSMYIVRAALTNAAQLPAHNLEPQA
jgi:hypothetical protein